MGRVKQNKVRRERPLPQVTHEPLMPLPGWPSSHASVELTGPDEDECFKVIIHGVEHLLHAKTARALSDALLEKLDEYNENIGEMTGAPAVADAMKMIGIGDLSV